MCTDKLLIFRLYHHGYVVKYKLLTGEDVFPEKRILEKAAKIKRFEYLPLGSELKKTKWYCKRSIKAF